MRTQGTGLGTILLAPGFTGSPRFGTAKDSVKPLRSSAELRRETALFLSWMLEPGRSSLLVDDGTGIVGVTGFDSTPCDPDRGEAMDNYFNVSGAYTDHITIH